MREIASNLKLFKCSNISSGKMSSNLCKWTNSFVEDGISLFIYL